MYLPSTDSRRNIRLRPNQDRFNSSTLGLLSNVLSSRIMSSSSAVVLQININIPVCVMCSYTTGLIVSDVVCKVCKVNQDENAFDYLVFINETLFVVFFLLLNCSTCMRMYNIYISLSSNIELSQFFFSFMSYYVYIHVYAQNIASNTSVFKLTKLKHVKT